MKFCSCCTKEPISLDSASSSSSRESMLQSDQIGKTKSIENVLYAYRTHKVKGGMDFRQALTYLSIFDIGSSVILLMYWLVYVSVFSLQELEMSLGVSYIVTFTLFAALDLFLAFSIAKNVHYDQIMMWVAGVLVVSFLGFGSGIIFIIHAWVNDSSRGLDELYTQYAICLQMVPLNVGVLVIKALQISLGLLFRKEVREIHQKVGDLDRLRDQDLQSIPNWDVDINIKILYWFALIDAFLSLIVCSGWTLLLTFKSEQIFKHVDNCDTIVISFVALYLFPFSSLCLSGLLIFYAKKQQFPYGAIWFSLSLIALIVGVLTVIFYFMEDNHKSCRARDLKFLRDFLYTFIAVYMICFKLPEFIVVLRDLRRIPNSSLEKFYNQYGIHGVRYISSSSSAETVESSTFVPSSSNKSFIRKKRKSSDSSRRSSRRNTPPPSPGSTASGSLIFNISPSSSTASFTSTDPSERSLATEYPSSEFDIESNNSNQDIEFRRNKRKHTRESYDYNLKDL